MSKWQVQLIGHPFDLEVVFENQQSQSWALIMEDDTYYLESSFFNNVEEDGDIRSIAQRIVTLINGSAKLRISGFRPIEINKPSFIDDDGTRKTFVFLQGSVTGRSKVKASGTVIGPDRSEVIKEDDQSDKIESTYSLAESDENVFDALRLYSINEVGWVEVYKIYEIIKDDVGGSDELLSREYALRRDIRNFSRTAQHPGAIGDDARHARMAEDVPENPMSLSEAFLLISTMLSKWIDSKLSSP